MILSIVHVAGCPGTLKVLSFLHFLDTFKGKQDLLQVLNFTLFFFCTHMNKTIFIDRLLLLQILGGKLLLELNRMLRPGGFFVWSATPIYQKLPEDVEIWEGTF